MIHFSNRLFVLIQMIIYLTILFCFSRNRFDHLCYEFAAFGLSLLGLMEGCQLVMMSLVRHLL